MKQFALAFAMAAALAACRATFDGDPEVRLRHSGYSISFDDDHYSGDRHFCPPGHHMKGWC